MALQKCGALRSQHTCLLWQPADLWRPRRQSSARSPVIVCRRSNGHGHDGSHNARSRKGESYENKKRRRGRPAWTRSPDDSPLRDGNRDRVVGLLTERSAKTLLFYLQETNLNLYYWLTAFMQAYPIPRDGAWDDVSGETFLRTLLAMPTQGAKFDVMGSQGREAMYDCVTGCGVDPRNIASRIMDIRSQLAAEFVQDLRNVAEENATLMRESVQFSFSLDNVVDHPLSRTKDASADSP